MAGKLSAYTHLKTEALQLIKKRKAAGMLIDIEASFSWQSPDDKANPTSSRGRLLSALRLDTKRAGVA